MLVLTEPPELGSEEKRPDERAYLSALAARSLSDDVSRAERASEAQRHDEAIAILRALPSTLVVAADPPFRVRVLVAESWALMHLGELRGAEALAERARALSEAPACTEIDRAEALYRLGCCRYKLSHVASAATVLTLALELCDRSSRPCDRLRVQILEWRSRCYQRQRDFDAARVDVERALELAVSIRDEQSVAHVYFQASLVAERTKQWHVARFYAEQAKDIYERCGDARNASRLLNNLGGLHFLLGDPETAIELLKRSVAAAFDVGSDLDAAQAVSSLALIHLRTGSVDLAEQQARHALELLDGQLNYVDEIGNARLVLGRALLEQGRLAEAAELFNAAEACFEELSSVSHRAAAWMAQGELADRSGEKDAAVALYRRAAEALQDLHF